jgi:DNA-binding GntR family transcriptional regulator
MVRMTTALGVSTGNDGPAQPQAQSLAEVIRQQIFEGTLRPGALLSQKALAESLGVSRIPVREALRVLDGQGLVVHEPGVGTRVRLFDEEGLRELYSVRQYLEGTLAEYVVRNITKNDIGELERLVDRMDAASDVDDWSDINWTFHSVIHRAAARPTTVQVLQHLFAQAEPYSRMYLRRGHHLDLAQSQHRRMITKIRDCDAETLATEMSQHIFGALDPLLPVVDDLARLGDSPAADRLVRPGANGRGGKG